MAAGLAALQQNQLTQQARRLDYIFSKMKEVAHLVAQLAVRFVFVVGSVLMAAAAFPMKLHNIAIPIVAIGTSFLAAFFYPNPTHIPIPPPRELEPLIRPLANAPIQQAVPPDLAAQAPRGLFNRSNNCWINSLVHYLESDPQFAHWARHPLTDGMDREAFETFLAGYEPPAQIIADFRAFIARQPNPVRPIPTLFKEFSDAHVPAPNDQAEFRNLKEKFNNLLLLQGPLSNFLNAYDQAVQENRPIVGADSQSLRLALNQITPLVSPAEYVQMDAPEPMQFILDLLPNHMKLKIAESYHFDTRGQRPLLGIEGGIVRQELYQGHMIVEIPPGETAPRIDRLIQLHCDDPTTLMKKSDDGVNREYPVTIRRQFITAPSVLRIQIKRFYNERLPDSILTRLKCFFWPEMGWAIGKRDFPVEVPEFMTLTLENGERRNYRLASSVNHFGNYGGGHYTAARDLQGNKYFMSDQNVTVADQASWNDRLRHSYLLCYLPVPA